MRAEMTESIEANRLYWRALWKKKEKRKSTTVKCGKQVRLLDNQAFGNWIWNTDAGGVGHWQM